MLATVGVGGYFLMYKAGKNATDEPSRSLRKSSVFESSSNPKRIVGGEWMARGTTQHHTNDDDQNRNPYKKTRGEEGSDLE